MKAVARFFLISWWTQLVAQHFWFYDLMQIISRFFLISWFPCATFRLHGTRGGVRRGGGRNILPSTPVAAKKTSADGGGIEVSSQDEALEETAVGTVGEPTLNQAKAGALRGPACGASRWGWSGAWRGEGERQRGVLVADSLVGIHPHPGSTRRGVRSRGEGRRRNEARRERRRRGGRRGERLEVGTGVGILGLMALLLVVTWNVRRLSVRETNRRRLRSVAERVRQERWEMVLLTEPEGRWGGSGLVGGGRGEGGDDPREEGGSNVKGRSARKVGGSGAAEVVWGEGSSGGGRGIEAGVSIPAKQGGRMGKAWKDVDRTWKGRWQWGTGKELLLRGGLQR